MNESGISSALRFLHTGPSGPRSTHRLKTWNVCERLSAFERFRPDLLAPSPHLIRGGVYHAGTGHAVALAAKAPGHEKLASPIEAIDRAAAPFGTIGEEAAVLAKKMVHGVLAWWKDRAPKPRVLHVEQSFEFVVPGPRTKRKFVYTQKPDLVVYESRMVFQEDWKGTAAFKRATSMSRYAPDIQFLAKRWWGPQMFENYGGARINLLNKHEPYDVKQAMCEPAPALVSDFPMIAEETELQMEDAEKRNGRDPWKYKPAADERICVNTYGMCAAWRACLWGSHAPGRGASGLVQINIPSAADGGPLMDDAPEKQEDDELDEEF